MGMFNNHDIARSPPSLLAPQSLGNSAHSCDRSRSWLTTAAPATGLAISPRAGYTEASGGAARPGKRREGGCCGCACRSGERENARRAHSQPSDDL